MGYAVMMIELEINKADKDRWMWALRKIQSYAKRWIEDEMQFRCATDYYQEVMRKISTQSFDSIFSPYNDRYANWKARYVGETGFYLLAGDLVNSLGAWRTNEGFMGGVRPGAMDTGGKSWLAPYGALNEGPSKEIAFYGSIVEFGGSKHKPRPVFKPTMVQYSKTGAGWRTRGREALDEIGKAWT
jgi:hypothetical protein